MPSVVSLRHFAAGLLAALPSVLFALMALTILATFTGLTVWPAAGLAAFTPAASDTTSALDALLSFLCFAALALGLLRQKQLSWWLAILILTAALLLQAGSAGVPLKIVVLGGVAAILLADRRRYRVQARLSFQRRFLAVVLLIVIILALEIALFIVINSAWPRAPFLLSGLTANVGHLLGLDDNQTNSVLDLSSRGGLLALLLLVARLPVILGALGILSREPELPADPAVRTRLKDIASRHGRGALLPFQMGPDKLIYCSPEGNGAITYGLAGRLIVVVGDPISPPPDRDLVLTGFLERNARFDRETTFYQADESFRPILLSHGYHLFRVGQEAVIELDSFSLTGPARANLRHTITRAQKGGLHLHFYRTGVKDDPELVEELRFLSRTWRERAGPSMGFTISDYDEGALRDLPVAVVFGPLGDPVAFTTFRPTNARQDCWVLDLMRRDRSAQPGAVEWCIAGAALAFAAEGAQELSLGLAPLYGLKPDQGPLAERLLALAARAVRPWYDVNSLGFFKAKFAPRWESRYGAVPSRAAIPGFCLALLRLHTRRGRLSAVGPARQQTLD